MPQNQPQSKKSSVETWDHAGFEAELTQLEVSLQALRSRYDQVYRDLARQQELQEQQDKLEVKSPQADLESHLKNIQTELNNLEISLESKLFSWKGFGDVFWQTVRFTGLGVILGWCLKALSGC